MPGFNLLDFTTRLQQLVTPQGARPPTCNFRSTFVQPLPPAPVTPSSAPVSVEGYLDVSSIDDLLLTVVSYLDGETLSRLSRVNTAWHRFMQQYREPLYRSLMRGATYVDHTPRRPPRSAFQSYLLALRDDVARELAHTFAVLASHQALEAYCRATPEHGFVAMFCDLVEFPDARLGRLVAWKRQSALGIVLAATPARVQDFRKHSRYCGPITFVPVENPHWPVSPLTPVEARGCMGYAIEHVRMVKGYEAVKETVVASIFKDLLIFDTTAHAAAYERSRGRPVYALSLDDQDAWAQVNQLERGRHLSFSSPLRRQVAKYPVATRIERIRAKLRAIDEQLTVLFAAQATAGEASNRPGAP
ncbi:hypothetical protein PsorP6_003015 [Peronosclerospora sorghi]|uniref:Uncharacterized protein n=1 Tax=Peronosclerospora sorghi TaxID=230839 RepID=A0ACC0VP33_9STRA|nr:hypothetical protein PsorP6_003015 [Peronosclerospora sorghi]